MSEWNQAIIREFRANEGTVGGRYADRTLLLLHTIGAKSGLPRVNPLVYLKDGDKFVVTASRGGAPTHPDWYYNLVANPEVEVEVGTERFQALAAVAAEPERTDLYKRMAEVNPFFGDYERKTTRVIPVIVLTRQG